MIYLHVKQIAHDKRHIFAVARPRSVCVLVEFRKRNLSDRTDSRFAEVVFDFFDECALAYKSVYKVDNLFVYDFVEYVFFDYLIDRFNVEVGEIIAYRSFFAYRLDKIGYHVFTFLVFDFKKLIYGHVEHVAYYEFHSLAVVRPRSLCVLVEFRKRNLSDRTYGQITRFLFEELNLIRRVQKFLYVYIEYNV